MKEVVIIGAGLTGLTVGYLLKKSGKDVLILEKNNRTGGAIQTHCRNGYIFEEGPNTGVVSNPEVAELFEMLGCEIETANESAEKRLILKNNKWHPLPNGPISFLRTPLFTTTDKLKILFEPLRKKGKNPNESVASLAARRIGQSFVDYAVNPFISGIYAGDPELLITRYALPKLYNLEQEYGSFIGGAWKKNRIKKTERDRKATKKVFSAKGGLSGLIQALEKNIGGENIICSADNLIINKINNHYRVNYLVDNQEFNFETKQVVTTSGAYALPSLLPFVNQEDINIISQLSYAKVIQIAVALKKDSLKDKYISFGGLIPKKESKDLLGVLFPSFCFEKRSPIACSLLAVYMGGVKRPDLYNLSDYEIENLVKNNLADMFEINEWDIEFMDIFRHSHAIPQYEISSGDRFKMINKIEEDNNGLIIAGNLRDGIGMADRIKQAFKIASQINEKYN